MIKKINDKKTMNLALLLCFTLVSRADGGYISVPSTVEEDTRMKTWLRDTLKVERAWLGISIRPKTAATTIDTVKWADGSAITGLPINNWVNCRGYYNERYDKY